MEWGRKWLAHFNAVKTQLVSFDRSKNTGAIDVKMDGSVLEEKPFFTILVLLVATWNCWISYRSKYTGLLVLHLLPFLNPWLVVEMQPA